MQRRLWNLFYFNQTASAIPGVIHGVTKTIDALNVAGCTEFNFKALGRQAQQQQTRALRELFSTVIELQVSVRDGDRVLRSPIVREVGIETPTNCILFSLADVIVRAARLAA